MSAISQKSISGITSITSPAGTDDQISLHTSNTNEALKIDGAGNLHLNNHVNTTGVSTASNFKTGSSNLHSTGLNVGNTFVHSTGINGSSADIDDFISVGSNIHLGNAGVVTATSFIGDGSDLTNLPAGLGTALSATASSPLNKMYYTNQVLGVPSSVTVDVPASASKAYTQYADIKVESSADLIVAEGDDLIPDILGLADFGTFGGGASAGRIRVNSISNAANDGSPTVQKGLIITGVTTSTSADINGDLDVDGHTNLDNVSIAGVTTMTGNLTINSSSTAKAIVLPDNKRIYFGDGEDFWIGSNGSNGEVSGSLWFYNHLYFYDNVLARFGNGSDLMINHNGTDSFVDNNTGSLYLDSADNIIFRTNPATERLRITSAGKLGVGVASPVSILHLHEAGSNGAPIIQFSNGDTGTTTGDGFAIGMADNESPFIYNRENTDLRIATNNIERLRIQSDGEVFIGTGLGSGNRSTLLSIAGANQDPSGVWTQVGVYSDDSQAADKGGSIGFGGQDGTTPKQQFAAIKGAKANSTSGNYEGYMSFFIRPNGAVSQERFRINANGTIAALAAGPSNFAGSSVQENYHQLVNSQAYNWIMRMRNMTWGYGLRIDVADDTTREGLMLYSDKSGVNQAKASIIMDGTFRSRNNTYTSYSDIKLKENIVDAGSQWDDIKGLKVRNFNFKIDDPSQKMIGVIAQEAETVCPNLVRDVPDREDKDGQRVETGTHTKEVKYSILYMKAIKCLQEAQARIETLEAKVAALEGS